MTDSEDDDASLDELEEQLLKFVEENELDDSGKREAMSSILDGEEALFSSRMKTWLLKDGITELLLEFMTRPPANSSLADSLRLHSHNYQVSIEHRRECLLERIPAEDGEEYDEDDDMGLQFTTEAKRADKAAEVFVHHFPTFPHDYVQNNMDSIISELFKIFDVKAEGDFDNFDKVFHCSLNINPTEIITILTAHPQFILHLLNYLQDSAVADTALVIMKTVTPKPDAVENFFKSLVGVEFFDYLGEKLYSEKGTESFEEASDFFIKLVELVCSYNGADILFETLGQNPKFVYGLVDCIVNESGTSSKQHQTACVFALRSLLIKTGEQLYDQSLESMGQVVLKNMLSGVHDRLHEYLKSKVGALAQRLLSDADSANKRTDNNVQYNTYTVSHRLTFAAMALFDIVLELAQFNPSEVLSGMGVYIWRVVSSWCFEHSFNNIYHDKFYALFVTVVKAKHTGALKALLSKYKFVTRIIDHFLTTTAFSSGFRGTILKICNFLRLQVDSLDRSNYLCNFLNSHQAWKDFLPILRAETMKQLITDYPAPNMVPVTSFGFQQDFSASNSKPLEPVTAENCSIDLGSEYANLLGFSGVVAYVPPDGKKKRRRRRKKNAKGNKADEVEEREETVSDNTKSPNKASSDTQT
eukprot:TRINITY_DN213_c0_g1_i1.p1 TRINITY_DN213_c0_g1~~TRINITY_DN213_c0_g1_i1.p1  ORF type:complete len:643 (-),score=92.13 TRINITY_DN213_c0_g1_i1:31-1959(-)